MTRLKLTVWQVLEHRIIESTWCWQNIDSKLNSEIDVLTWDHRVPARLRAIRFGFIPFDDTTPLLANVPHFLEHWHLKKPTWRGSLGNSYLLKSRELIPNEDFQPLALKLHIRSLRFLWSDAPPDILFAVSLGISCFTSMILKDVQKWGDGPLIPLLDLWLGSVIGEAPSSHSRALQRCSNNLVTIFTPPCPATDCMSVNVGRLGRDQ